MSNDNFSHNPAKFLSIFVGRMVPDYVREDHPMFITFMEKYFEYLERETGVNGELGEYKQITDLIQNVDIDHSLDLFIPEFEKQYLSTTPHTSIDATVPTTDKAFLAKNIQPVYREKGTASALDFLFRRDFNTEVELAYPKEFMFKASASTWYEPQWINVGGHSISTGTHHPALVTSASENVPHHFEIPTVELPVFVPTFEQKMDAWNESIGNYYIRIMVGMGAPEDLTEEQWQALLDWTYALDEDGFANGNLDNDLEGAINSSDGYLVSGVYSDTLAGGHDHYPTAEDNPKAVILLEHYSQYYYNSKDWIDGPAQQATAINLIIDGSPVPWVAKSYGPFPGQQQNCQVQTFDPDNESDALLFMSYAVSVVTHVINGTLGGEGYGGQFNLPLDENGLINFGSGISQVNFGDGTGSNAPGLYFDLEELRPVVTWLLEMLPTGFHRWDVDENGLLGLSDDAVGILVGVDENPETLAMVSVVKLVSDYLKRPDLIVQPYTYVDWNIVEDENGLQMVAINNSEAISKEYTLYHFDQQDPITLEWSLDSFQYYDDDWLAIADIAEGGGEFDFAGVNTRLSHTSFIQWPRNPELSQKSVEITLPSVDGNIADFYNKKITGQTSNATAFVDVDESLTLPDETQLLLTQIEGNFVQGEEILEDVGTSGNVPMKARIISEGIRSDGECVINGSKWNDKWINITGPRTEVKHATDNTIVGETSGAFGKVGVLNVNWTRFDLTNISGEFIVGERIYNTSALNYDPNPTGSFCSSNNEWPLGSFLTERECVAAMHPEANDPNSDHFEEYAFLQWFPFLTVTQSIQDVASSYLESSVRPTTREKCDYVLQGHHPKVNTSVWVPNGDWLDSTAFISSDRKMQDNDYYQDFSYVIKSDVPIQSYREVLKKLVHPVGLKLFAEFAFQSSVDMTVELPTDYTKLLINIFSYLDVAMDIWDQESEQHGTIGRAHTGFGLYLDQGFEEYVIEILGTLENRSALIKAESWAMPSDHLSINFEITGGKIGVGVQEKLWTVSWLNDNVRNSIDAFPETTTLEFTKQLKVLPIDEFPPSVTELAIEDGRDGTTDGRMISCTIWELAVLKAMRRVVEFVDSFMPEAEYAYEKSYEYFESNRESGRIQNIYGKTNDVIDSVHIGAFDNSETGRRIHSHGEKDGFAPLVETVVTKGLELPVMDVGASAFHVHYFDDTEIKNLIVHGKEVTARGINYDEARRLIDRDYFEIPHMHGANLLCGGIMTPPLWGDWVDSNYDDRYNGVGECFNSAYTDAESCIAAYNGNPMFWMPPMCSNMSNMSEEVCNGMGDLWEQGTSGPLVSHDGDSINNSELVTYGAGTWNPEIVGVLSPYVLSGISETLYTIAVVDHGQLHNGVSYQDALVPFLATGFSNHYVASFHEWLNEDVEDASGFISPRWDMNRDGVNTSADFDTWYYGLVEGTTSLDAVVYDFIWEHIVPVLSAGFNSSNEWTLGTPSFCWSSEESCNAVGHSWGYFTLADLPPMKGHASFFVQGQVVDRQRGRYADPLTREQARFLIDNPLETVTLYDNIGYLDEDGNVQVDENHVTQGGTITNIHGNITSGHYHEYSVSYDPEWQTKQDWQNNDLTHGFVYTPVVTWLCFNYNPALPVDPTIMGGMDFLGNQWPQNVFMEVSDEYVAGFLNNPDVTLQHNQVWPADLNPNVDWVELYSSNHIAEVPGVGDTGDLIGVEKIGVGTDIATIEAFPSSVQADTVAIIDMSGYIFLMNENTGTQTLLLDLSTLQHVIGLGSFANYDERGVLGLAFHPDYSNNGKFYVYYMTEQGGGTGAWGFPLSSTVISEFTAGVDKLTADISSERILMTIPQPDFNHNGGELAFGPDGYLYIGLGDGGSAGDTSWATGHGGHGPYGNAQNPSNLLGNILRIDITEDTVNGIPYTIPADNPFLSHIYKEGQPEATPYKPEIYAMGFRNPWRFSFAEDGKLWVADVGQDKFEEINIVEAGGNYGWRIIEGYHEFEEDQAIVDQIAIDLGFDGTLEFLSSLKAPIHEYSHGTGISILGGFIYRGAITELQGKYIFGDWSTNWGGTSGHLYTLSENFDGNSANFNALANPVNGATHSHTFSLTGSQVQFLKDNPGQTTTALQTDTTHAEFYVHIFTVLWSSVNQEFVLIGQTNPEGHDTLEFIEYGTDLSYDRTPLSIWDPVTELVDLTTMGESILTMGETESGEIIFSTRLGINTFQAPSGEGPNNTDLYKIIAAYNSIDIPNAPEQIPSTETAHVHGYQVTYTPEDLFETIEISDIEMTNWDSFWPEWTDNDPQSHIHPVNTAWTGVLDNDILIGSSAGWYYNTESEAWEPYDIGADTPWAPPEDDASAYVYIESAPIVTILGANEYGENMHVHYFDSSGLDTFGDNSGRLATPITRIQAEELANGVVTSINVFSNIADSGAKLHYHEYQVLYNASNKQFIALPVAEFNDPLGTGEWGTIPDETRNHEHTLTVDGITTNLGWNGTPLYNAPDVTLALAHDWDNLSGSESDHLHSFNGTTLDTLGINAGRISSQLTDEQATDLINGDVVEVIIYSSIVSSHYHGIKVTYDAGSLAFIAEDVEHWFTVDNSQYLSLTPRTHAHGTAISNQISVLGFNEELLEEDLPEFASPGYPFPGGSHPHFHNGTVVGPFAWNNEIDYSNGLTVSDAMSLIDGLVGEVTIYDSIEGAHFHEYIIKWNTDDDIFIVDRSTTWLRGGIEDIYQDSSKYYPSVVENESEGLHWHNLTIEWNPDEAVDPQQTGGSVYVTKVATETEVLTSDPQTTIETQSTALAPITTTYDDTPEVGDETVITVYNDFVTTTVTSTTTVVTTLTTTTYYSDGTSYVFTGAPVTTTESSETSTSEQIEDLDQRQTRVNDILQANQAPIIYVQSTFIDGEGSHDHLLYTGCTLDTEGPFTGRLCEPLSVAEANLLVNAQDVNFGWVFYDSPNGANSHYHAYVIRYNSSIGEEGEFAVEPISQYDQIAGTGTTIHKFLLTGGFHQHDYWLTVDEYVELVLGLNQVAVQRDTIHADLYTHEITIGYSGGTYNLVLQTNDVDGHNLVSYIGSIASGGEWLQSDINAGLGDHIHETIIDETNVWPVVV
jgi:hypothetical protein